MSDTFSDVGGINDPLIREEHPKCGLCHCEHPPFTTNTITKLRVQRAFDTISKANTVSILSLDEMEHIVLRALSGEFDSDPL